jgi:DNA-binding IclR family transcriptional regulator
VDASVATPTRNHTGTVVAAISISRRLDRNPDTARNTALGQKG